MNIYIYTKEIKGAAVSKKNRIRIYLNVPLAEGAEVVCPESQAHYLLHVMRLATGAEVFVFNGRDGEFRAQISAAGKKNCHLKIVGKFCDFCRSPDVWLLFAPLKKDNTDFVVAKAVELGVSKIVPVATEFSAVAKIRSGRLESQIIEAAEQCRRQDIPVLASLTPLREVLAAWPVGRRLIYLDESGQSGTVGANMGRCPAPAAVLCGPEGGFSEKELEYLRKLPYTCGISLGARILRAETAAVAALACWQAWCGDWGGED